MYDARGHELFRSAWTQRFPHTISVFLTMHSTHLCSDVLQAQTYQAATTAVIAAEACNPQSPPLFLVVAWMHRKATALPPSPQLKLPLSSSIWLARSTVSSRIMAALHLGRHESPNPSSGGRHGCARQCWFVIRNCWGTTSEN